MINNTMRICCQNLGLSETPLLSASKYCPSGNLFVKVESRNRFGSIKARSAFYMLSDVVHHSPVTKSRLHTVESSSGNLAVALHGLANYFGVSFICLSDETIPESKKVELQEKGVQVQYVSKGHFQDFRSARIATASKLGKKPGWIWLNQYANPANAQAHYETTGPEIWEQTKGTVRWVVISVGSGGTLCGVSKFLKEIDTRIQIVGVEPLGSTSFGGESHAYIAAGSGMRGPSELLLSCRNNIDFFAQVSDSSAAWECKQFEEREGYSVGLTTGHCLAVGSIISTQDKSPIVVISADDGDHYKTEIMQLNEENSDNRKGVHVKKYIHSA